MTGYFVQTDAFDPSRWVLLRWHGNGWEVWDRGRGRYWLWTKLLWHRVRSPVPRRMLP